MTNFRALRNFLLRPGVDVIAGDVLELTDEEASLFVAMPGTIEPVAKADRCRVVQVPRVTWDAPAGNERTAHGWASQPWAVVLPGDVGYSVGRLH